MKKKEVLNLIKYHYENNENGFKNTAYNIAQDFENGGDSQLSQYVMSLISDTQSFIPMNMNDGISILQKVKIDQDKDPLMLPEAVKDDLIGITNAVRKKAGICRFLFYGSPGTGKTEAVKRVAELMDRELYMVNSETLIDSRLGQTSKNIIELIDEINSFSFPDRVIVLFDEIDLIALNRIEKNDLREMGRATTTFLKLLDQINDQVVIIGTTNLYDRFDQALLRRFDYCVDFDRYTSEDYCQIAESFLNFYVKKFGAATGTAKLLQKIMKNRNKSLTPGELKNIIRTAVAFSDSIIKPVYYKQIADKIMNLPGDDVENYLHARGFTVREIEILTNIPKSSVALRLGGNK